MPDSEAHFYIGTAGWSLSARHATEFSGEGTHLQRHAARLNAVEINSCFYRHHRPETYARWAADVPADFRFCVKVPKALTHGGALDPTHESLARFADEVAGLGSKLAVALVQLPPRLEFDAALAEALFSSLDTRIKARLVCEPRHASWGSSAADALFQAHGVARVAADPPRWANDAHPGGARAITYFRLHGSPRMYFSNYEPEQLEGISARLRGASRDSKDVWCIFDNTGGGFAAPNALGVAARLRRPEHSPVSSGC